MIASPPVRVSAGAPGRPVVLPACLAAVLLVGCDAEVYNFLADGETQDVLPDAPGEIDVAVDDGPAEFSSDAVDEVAPDAADEGGESIRDVREDGPRVEDARADGSSTCTPDDDAGDAGACPSGLACCPEDSEAACVDLAFDPRHCGECGNGCDASEECVAAECRCLPGLVRCDGECLSLADDPEHCGACDIACDAGHGCIAGHCVP